MSTTNDGGPAFPATVQDDRDCAGRYAGGYGGMSMRDYFAAKSIETMIRTCGIANLEFVANKSYELADSMLEARKATK